MSYDPAYGLATITGPAGFTQIQMTEQRAAALARIVGFPYEVREQIARADG